MTYEKIVTLFDSAEHAEAAQRNLEKAGFAISDTSIVGKQGLAGSQATLREPGFWHRLFGNDIEEHEAIVYGKTVDSGGVVLTVRAIASEVPKALGILNQHNVVDVRHRAIEAGALAKSAVAPAVAVVAVPPKPLTTDLIKSEVLRLAEEQLEVGKRLVNEGSTRIRRFVIEKPVEAKVTLHEEHAEVVRRAITDPSYVKDVDWTDKTIEVLETDEEPIVTKSVHFTEEVLVGKKGSDRVETVRDTVRQQQLDVERRRGERRV